MINNNHNNSCACSQCAPVPTQPLAPPPVCPDTGGCEEYIGSDCVISDVNANCTHTFTDCGYNNVTIGLQIQAGVTTLSNVYQQLTTTACITNPAVISGLLNLIATNNNLFQCFSQLVCDVNCDDPCADIVTVSQAVFTNVTNQGFDITFLAQPGYQYQIRINDTSTLPATYYTWASTIPPNNASLVPIPFTINTSVFTQFTGTPPISSGPPSDLNPSSTHEVYVTAEDPNGLSCETGPWTVVTLADPACPPECDQISLTITPDPSVTTNLAFFVNFQIGPIFPAGYLLTIYDTDGNTIVGPDAPLTISNAPAIDPITQLYPATSTQYNWPLITDPRAYIIQVTPVCSTAPVYCLGTQVQSVINFTAPSTCSPPDITSVVVTSPVV